MIPNSLMVLNGKGGVLKTSLAANLSGLAAVSGWKVLAVDLDPQGNLAGDFGCLDRSDGGEALLQTVLNGAPLKVLQGVRPNLDLAAGGPQTATLAGFLTSQALTGESDGLQLDRALQSVSDHYNLVVLDCPPGEALIHTIALNTAHFVVVPTQPDDASIYGLTTVFRRYLQVRKSTNPHLEILGVVLGPVGTQSTALLRVTRDRLVGLLGERVRVFSHTIRLAQAAAVDARNQGLLAHEYEALAASAQPWYRNPSARRYSSAASGLASDYEALIEEIFAVFAERQKAFQARVGAEATVVGGA